MTTSSEYSEGISPRNIPTDILPQNIPTAKVSRNIPTAEFPRNIPTAEFPRNILRAYLLGISRRIHFLGIFRRQRFLGIFRRPKFADENDGEPVDDFVLMKTAHTNKHNREIDDGVVRDVLSLIETQKEDEETRLSQLQTDLDATSTASTNLSRIRINEIVESGRLVVLGRQARSVPPSAPQPYVDPEVLMDQLKDKNDRIAALEQKMADQEAGWEATRNQNEKMMEMMKMMYPNEQFP
ncbi:hypothetical protein F2Q68_00045569 [Brassica cretica]|uniref:Uncharacterized protein n=1 Tax=Brassica cretica TaxID=69181 RepID=A0A8S9LQD6_BRACR|nr:hypothetical protein F2Q68_00045569 [Brassica cretica]